MSSPVEKEFITGEGHIESDDFDVVTKLADGIANEINNVLATIMGLASVIEADLTPNSLSYQDIQGILAASRRGLKLTRNLLGFGKSDKCYFEEISLNTVIGKIKSIIRQNMPSRIQIQTYLDQDISHIMGDASQIKRVLLNLSINSIDAIKSKGTITLTTKEISLGLNELAELPNLTPGRYVRLQVSDDGVGMDQHTLSNAPKPFFTTKDPKKYSGLGLLSVISSIRKHGGDVTFFSREGIGTTVTIYLPVYTEVTKDLERVRRLTFGGENYKVLMVDDEKLFRNASKRIIEKLGHSVIEASSGSEALSIYQKEKGNISFVILDLLMPDMNGEEVFEELKKINPKVRVILSTGYTREEPIKDMITKGAVGFIQKPYTMKQLASVFRNALK